MIYLVRHAQSTVNAGKRVENANDALLTEKGVEQALDFAHGFSQTPDLIVHSPLVRAVHTARPLIDRFPDAVVETWDIHEFQMLGDATRKNTTLEERKVICKEQYYSRNDLDFVHGKGAESFNQMLNRVDNMLARLKNIQAGKVVVVFTHELFMKTALMRMNSLPINFETFINMEPIENMGVIVVPYHTGAAD